MGNDKNLLNELRIYMISIGMFLVIMTFFVNMTGHSAIGFTGLWYELDLRIEGSMATWLEMLLILLCAIPSYLVYREKDTPTIIRAFYLLMVFAILFLAADEMLSIHEYIGQKFSEATGVGAGTFLEGFSWVLLYAPAMAVGLLMFLFSTRKLFLTADSKSKRRFILDLIIIFLSVCGVLLLEIFEAYIFSQNSKPLILPSFEESLEILVILGFYDFTYTLFNMYSSRNVDE